jgi:hypothetical protein
LSVLFILAAFMVLVFLTIFSMRNGIGI